VRVQMVTALTGTINGEDWPPLGAVADIPDALASDLIFAGHAIVAEAPADPPPVVESASFEPAETAAKTKPRRRRAAPQE